MDNYSEILNNLDEKINNDNYSEIFLGNWYKDTIKDLPLSQSVDISTNDVNYDDDKVYEAWKNIVLGLLENEIFVNGEKTKLEDFLRSSLNSVNKDTILVWLEKLYFDVMQNNDLKIGILHTISHIPYKLVYPAGQSLALTGLTDPCDEVIEFSIKAFENWEDKDSVYLLKGRQLKKKWLQEYLDEVVEILEETK